MAVATSALLWTRVSASAAWLGLLAGAATLLVLRGALTRRSTAWISAVVGTLTIASAGGALAWLFGHVAETPAAPSIAAVLGAVVAALPPAWGYSLLARRTLDGRDSVVPSSAAPFSG